MGFSVCVFDKTTLPEKPFSFSYHFGEGIVNEDANILLEDAKATFRVPQDAFVFLMQQGYEFCFFHVEQEDDPPVYYYLEGDAGFTKKWDYFSSFLLEEFASHAKSVDNLNNALGCN